MIKNKKGQVSLMVAIMMMTFLFFFCFVVNVGMLVNAKIQLQNAADLAAYAGAAVQARQLNRISFLNYEMRRQYKKFLFRYYVIGNMAQAQFPTQAEGVKPNTPYKWSPDSSQANALDFHVPAVCLIFNSNDNYCHVNKLPKINIPPPTGFDMINDALRNNLQALEKIRQSSCGKIALTNLYTLALWLYNGDPDAAPDLQLSGLGPGYENAQKIVDGLVKGLGLVPREILLRMRIETLKKYLNESAKSGLNKGQVDSLSSSGDPHKHERTIQAFNSAFYTLGDHTFSSDGITMDEIESNDQIELSNNNVRFDTWAIYFDVPPNGSNNTPPKDCDPHLVPQSMKSDVTVGVSKDPNKLTYYAVRLKAKAKLLFNPWGSDGIELRAYAAAQPFGSRIGPQLTQDAWVRADQPPANTLADYYTQSGTNAVNGSIVGFVPNLPVSDDDSLQKGWNTREVLGMLVSTAFQPTGANKSINEKDIARAYQLAMSPNPYEAKLYNIPINPPNDPGHHFSPGIFDSNRAALLWAPLAPPDSPSDLDSQLKSTIEDLFRDVGTDGSSQQLKDALKSQLGAYVSKLRAGQDLNACGATKLAQGIDDSDCESFNLVRLTNSWMPRPTASGGGTGNGPLPLPAWFMPQTPKDILTSWNAPNDPPSSNDAGRLGYSVKFISFDSLLSGKIQTDSKNKTAPGNPPASGDDEARIDMTSIQH